MRKMLFFIWLSPRYKIPELFTIASYTRPHLHFDGLLPNSRRSVVSIVYKDLGCVTSITEKKLCRSGLTWSRNRRSQS